MNLISLQIKTCENFETNLENLKNLIAKIGLNRTTMQELDRTQKRSLTGQ